VAARNVGGHELRVTLALPRIAPSTASPTLVGLPGLAANDGVFSEVQRIRALIHDLRNPVGSVGIAVDLLLAMLGDELAAIDEGARLRAEGVLNALRASAEQLRHLVHDLNVHAPSPVLVAPVAPAAAAPTAVEPARPRALSVAAAAPAHDQPVLVDELLRRLEVLTVTRCARPALLAVDATPGLRIPGTLQELLRALSNLVENGIEAAAAAVPGEGPWTVEVRVVADGEWVLLDVLNDGAAPSLDVQAWVLAPLDEHDAPSSKAKDGGLHGVGLKAVRRAVEPLGGKLELLRQGRSTVARVRLPRR
jgi:signal transduction histidine kinase